jgi:hypothetical protein
LQGVVPAFRKQHSWGGSQQTAPAAQQLLLAESRQHSWAGLQQGEPGKQQLVRSGREVALPLKRNAEASRVQERNLVTMVILHRWQKRVSSLMK